MAKFLNTTGVSYHLEELIKGTKDRLVLISPYLQFSERIKEHLRNLNTQKRDIRIVYRENKLQPEETNWLAEQIGVRTSLCKNLHAKCYLNEAEALVTSMNLYEFSQVNNNEMGIHISKTQDPELYAAVSEEAQRLLTISTEIRVTVQQVLPANSPLPTQSASPTTKSSAKRSAEKHRGFCIRTGVEIPFNINKPLSAEAYKIWSKYKDRDYAEKYCHFSGEESDGETSVNRPVLKKNWAKAKEQFGPLTIDDDLPF